MRTALISHPDCADHEMFDGHPECRQRLAAISDHLIAQGLYDLFPHLDAPRVTDTQLERVHARAYLDHLEAISPERGLAEVDPDTWLCPATLKAARFAVGAVVRGVDEVVGGRFDSTFCLVRPPGHHAERARGMGFCVYNNIAAGAAHALAAHGLERVAIVDFDVHHGNGTEEIFQHDPRVLVCSTYQHPYYPYTKPIESPRLIHCPLPGGAGGAEFRAAIETQWLPALDAFRPQLLLVSAGFDGHAQDEMGGLMLTEVHYRWVTERLRELAERHCGGRIVSALEGGYHLGALARSVSAHLQALAGI